MAPGVCCASWGHAVTALLFSVFRIASYINCYMNEQYGTVSRVYEGPQKAVHPCLAQLGSGGVLGCSAQAKVQRM